MCFCKNIISSECSASVFWLFGRIVSQDDHIALQNGTDGPEIAAQTAWLFLGSTESSILIEISSGLDELDNFLITVLLICVFADNTELSLSFLPLVHVEKWVDAVLTWITHANFGRVCYHLF